MSSEAQQGNTNTLCVGISRSYVCNHLGINLIKNFDTKENSEDYFLSL